MLSTFNRDNWGLDRGSLIRPHSSDELWACISGPIQSSSMAELTLPGWSTHSDSKSWNHIQSQSNYILFIYFLKMKLRNYLPLAADCHNLVSDMGVDDEVYKVVDLQFHFHPQIGIRVQLAEAFKSQRLEIEFRTKTTVPRTIRRLRLLYNAIITLYYIIIIILIYSTEGSTWRDTSGSMVGLPANSITVLGWTTLQVCRIVNEPALCAFSNTT